MAFITHLESQFLHVRLAASMCLAQIADELPTCAVDVLLEKLRGHEPAKKLFDTGQANDGIKASSDRQSHVGVRGQACAKSGSSRFKQSGRF